MTTLQIIVLVRRTIPEGGFQEPIHKDGLYKPVDKILYAGLYYLW